MDTRLAYLDNLKWVLIALIIATHAATAYGAVGAWFYVEPTLSPIGQALLSAPSEAGILFGLETFMLVAGLLTAPALARKGPGTFLRDRVLRLGLPFVAAVAVVTPAVYWLILEVIGRPATLLAILQWQLHNFDPGPMWFVAVLLIFTACYVGWRWIRPARKTEPRPLQMRHLLIAAALIGPLSFMVWLVFPLGSVQPFELQLWEWPQLAVTFALGVLAGERGWLAHRPSAPIRRTCWLAPLPALGVVAWMLVAYRSTQPPYISSLIQGWHWQAAVLAVVWGVAAVGWSLAMVDLFRQFGTWSGRLFRALGRDSYAAYFLQTPVLVALELSLRVVGWPGRGLGWPGEVKVAISAPAGIAISFALAWAIRRIFAAAKRRRWRILPAQPSFGRGLPV
jgi:glucans biosynthesis protein C